MNELVYRAVTAVEEGLTSAPAASLGFADRAAAEGRPLPSTSNTDPAPTSDILYPESRLEIEHGVHQLETLLESTVDKNFDKLEIFVLRSILSVPEDLVQWLQLKHYEVRAFKAISARSGKHRALTLALALAEPRLFISQCAGWANSTIFIPPPAQAARNA